MFKPSTELSRYLSNRFAVCLASLSAVLAISFYPTLPAKAQEEEVIEIPKVVVSASRVPLPAAEVGSAVTVITEEELEERQVRIVSDVLRDVPGLAVSRSGPVGAFTQVRIRGAEGNQTLVLIDGIEVNNPAAQSEFDFANLLNTEIERIEVLRGPQSALYGSDSIGGVINIVTKRPEAGVTAVGRGEAGSFATRDGLINLGYGMERGYLSGTFNRFVTNGISAADENDGNSEADSYANTTGRVKAGITPFEFLEIDAVGYWINSDRQADAFAPNINVIDSDDESETRERYGRLSAKVTLFEGAWEQIASATYIDVNSDFFDGSGTETFASDGEKDTFSYQSNLFFSTPDFAEANHGLTFVAEREREEQYTEGNSIFSPPNAVQIVNYGYVGEYRVGLWERLFLSGSLRFDDNDNLFDNELTYRATGAYLHTETGTRLHGSVGRGVKNPTLFELFGSTPTFTGNPDLTPEESIGWDIGVEQSLFDERLLVDVTYFNNRIKDLIQGSASTAVNLDGTSKIQGIEVSASVEPLDGLRLNAAYTYTDGQDAQGTELVRTARHIASFNANYGFELFGRPGNINLGVRYNGDQQDLVFTSPVTRTTLDAFTLVNLAASYEVYDGVELFARGENLLNEHYQEVFGYGEPGIAGYAGVRIKLGPFADDLD